MENVVGEPDRLRILATAIRGRVTSCNHLNANQGQVERREVKGKLRNYRVRIGEAASWHSLEINGFETSLAFALGAPDKICLMDQRLDAVSGLSRLPIFVSATLGSKNVGAWLKVPRHQLALKALSCSKREPLFVYRNGLTLLANTDRASAALLPLLADLADCLPRPIVEEDPKRVVIEGLELIANLLPVDLRKLAPHIERWAVGDDVDRRERLTTAKRGELATLLKEVGPLLGRIDNYLDSFGSKPLPDEAVLIGQLAEAVAEVRAEA